MIEPGLARIGVLLRNFEASNRTWKAIHVAGTNGKGSICAYLSALLRASGYSVGRFTSPHLIDRWDCISINDMPILERNFREVEEMVVERDRLRGIGATEFELLTATAFEAFERARVDYGVVEVGMGGRLDATNVLGRKEVTVISKVGLDHQSFLGDTLEEIALHKAGIMRPGVPCVVDDTNPAPVLAAIGRRAKQLGCEVWYPAIPPALRKSLAARSFEPHQIQNLACAYGAFMLACPSEKTTPLAQLLYAVEDIWWPGRLQKVNASLGSIPVWALLDGAHNVQSAEVLAAYVQKHIRKEPHHAVTWVLAASAGKDLGGILRLLLRPQDNVAAVRFGPVDGMPWVVAEDTGKILDLARDIGISPICQYEATKGLEAALQWAGRRSGGGGGKANNPFVIAGSLYLVSDTLRLLRNRREEAWQEEAYRQLHLDPTSLPVPSSTQSLPQPRINPLFGKSLLRPQDPINPFRAENGGRPPPPKPPLLVKPPVHLKPPLCPIFGESPSQSKLKQQLAPLNGFRARSLWKARGLNTEREPDAGAL